MVNEETGNGFFSRLKNVFSSTANTSNNEDTAHESLTATTTLTEEPVMTGQAPTANVRGYLSTKIGPAWATDSYLVPAEGY